MERTKFQTKGDSKLIEDKRASRSSAGYLHDGKEVVTFNPPLSVEEWEYLKECQKITIKLNPEAESKEKKHGKEKTEQTKSESSEQD